MVLVHPSTNSYRSCRDVEYAPLALQSSYAKYLRLHHHLRKQLPINDSLEIHNRHLLLVELINPKLARLRPL